LIRVLCVDDDSGILELTETFLEDGDYIGVTPVLSATSALEILEKEAFDVIVSDYRMPSMDGISFLKALRAKADQTPFIIFTGVGRDEVIPYAMNNGANAYIQKGADAMTMFGNLKSAVVQLTQRRRMERALVICREVLQPTINGFQEAASVIQRGRFLYANKGCARMFGFERPEDLMREPAIARVLPDLREEAMGMLMKLESKGAMDFIHVTTMLRADGSRFKVMIGDYRVELDDGPACLACLSEVTERGKANMMFAGIDV